MSKKEQYRSWVEVDLDNFAHNWDEIKRLVGREVKVLQVVKADAYGHGAIEISNCALKKGAAVLGVANADEGVQLRISGITAPVLILSPSTDSEINEIIKYNLVPSVSDLGFARELQKKCEEADIRVPIHIEVDTGMGRSGTIYREAFAMIREIFSLPNLIVEGIFTHLAVSEVVTEYSEMQWNLFQELLDKLEKQHLHIPIRHISNSGAIMNFPRFHLDMVRAGIMTYGIHPSRETKPKADLAPVMSFKTRVVLIKEFQKGCSIGYGRSYVTDRVTCVATIPIGYSDGYGLILSNQGEVLIRGKRAPIVGRISMDMCTVDVSHIKDCRIGDEVVLMGYQGSECISANEIADRVKTISYEILCALGKRAPRIFLQKGETDTIEPRLRRIFIPDEEKSISRIDNIIRRCFQTRAQNAEFGDAVYYEMFETFFGKDNRQLELRTDFRYHINISDLTGEKGEDPLKEDYFRVTTHIEYTKILRDHIFMIGCATNNEQLAALFEDRQCEYRWLLNHSGDHVTERDFRVEGVRIDGQNIPIIKKENKAKGYEVWCRSEDLKERLNRQVLIEIEIATTKSKKSKDFSVYLVYPTRGLEISFNYGGTKIRNVREISFFAGKHPYPEVVREEGKAIRLRISENEWIFPNSGVTFIWEL
ncbi:MAG: alanine racemase [Syntrophales bacterium]